MKRRKLKAPTQAIADTTASAQVAHDRQATQLPMGAISAPVLVQDVYDREKLQVATLSLRDDPLGALWARHHIDDAKYVAGRKWQQYYETAMIGAVKAMDTTKEPVDGGGISPEILTERRRKAMAELIRCSIALGRDGDALVRDVLGKGMQVYEAALARGYGNPRGLLYVGARFRECLECLAREFGYA